GQAKQQASAVVVHFVEDFLGENFLCLPEMEPLKKVLDLSKRGLVINGRTKLQINRLMNGMIGESGLKRLSSLFAIFDILAHSTDYEPLASPNYLQHTQGHYSDRYSKITDYILRNFHREISLNEVASVA